MRTALWRTRAAARPSAVRRLPPRPSTKRWLASGSDSITYSGGQATEGQGGYYGSGGARVISQDNIQAERSMLLALAADVEKMESTTAELEKLESLLRSETDTVSNKAIELKSSIKKLVTSPDVKESLNRLISQGEPVWGLSTREREMIVYLKDKMQEV